MPATGICSGTILVWLLRARTPSIWTARPTMSYEDFIMNEVRYNALARSNPDRAKELFAIAEKTAADKYERLVRMSEAE